MQPSDTSNKLTVFFALQFAKLQAFWMTIRLHSGDIASIIAGSTVILLEILSLGPSETSYQLVGFAAALAIAIPIIRILAVFSHNRDRFYAYRSEQSRKQMLDKLQLSPVYLQNGYEHRVFECNGFNEHYVESDVVNRFLFNGSTNPEIGVPLAQCSGRYRMPIEVRAMSFSILARFFKHNGDRLIHNGKLLRMATDILPYEEKFESVEVQMSRYYEGQATNEIVFQLIPDRDSLNKCFYGGTLLLDHENQLIELWDSRCANFIGASTIVITSNSKILLGKQGARALANRDRLAPSGSGSVDYRDYRKAKQEARKEGRLPTLQEVVIRAAHREFREECAIKKLVCEMSTVVIGYARLLERGGKPDFFCLTFINKPSDELLSNFNSKLAPIEKGVAERPEPITLSSDSSISQVLSEEIDRRQRAKRGAASIQLKLCADQIRVLESTSDGGSYLQKLRERYITDVD